MPRTARKKNTALAVVDTTAEEVPPALAPVAPAAQLPAPGELASRAVDALAMVIRDKLEPLLAKAQHEALEAPLRLDKMRAVVFANPTPENEALLHAAYFKADGAPRNLDLAEAAVKDARALMAMAEQVDKMRAAGGGPEAFRKELAARLAKARTHLDKAMVEVSGAFEAQAQYQAAAVDASKVLHKLAGKLSDIRADANLTRSLPRRGGPKW